MRSASFNVASQYEV